MKASVLIGVLVAAACIASAGQELQVQRKAAYFCPPCRDGSCDTIAYDLPGICPVCQMPLIEIAVPEKIGRRGNATAIEPFIGYWRGAGRSEGQQLNFSLEITKDSTVRVLFSSDEIHAQKIPGADVNIVNDTLLFDLTGDTETLSFKAGVKQGRMNGTIKKTPRITNENHSPSASFTLRKTQKGIVNYANQDVGWKNGDVTLSGSLYLPKGRMKAPVIVFTHGSGPEQRYANSFMADYFAKRGIAALIYDKRGTGKSTGNWQTSDYEDLADDCCEGIAYLKTLPQIDAAKIGIFGHSQGGTISPLIATRSQDVAFAIASAAVGVSWEDQDIYRVTNILRTNAGFASPTIDSAIAFYKIWLTVAKTGTGRDALDRAIPNAEKSQWYPWVAPPPKDNWVWQWYMRASKYDPLPDWEKVGIPVLLLFGEKDLITPSVPSMKKIQAALKKAGNTNVKTVMFPAMTHEGFILGKPDEFWHKAAPGYCDTVYRWLQSNILSFPRSQGNSAHPMKVHSLRHH